MGVGWVGGSGSVITRVKAKSVQLDWTGTGTELGKSSFLGSTTTTKITTTTATTSATKFHLLLT